MAVLLGSARSMTRFLTPASLVACALALLLSACVPDSGEDVEPAPDAGEPCVGLRCQLDVACPEGAIPDLATGECSAVGWTDCPAGFVVDSENGSCRELLPASACTGTTRALLGSSVCAPVGDCEATFPPPDATHFVDDGFTAAQLDATHFRRILDAIAAAPAGAVIAVEQGSYPEALEFPRSVTLVGRCPSQVVLDGRSQGLVGLNAVQPGTEVEVRGLTVSAHGRGAMIFDGASLTLRDVVLRELTQVGVVASGAGSRALIERSVVRDTGAGKPIGWGVAAEQGGALTLRDSVVSGSVQAGAVVRHAGSSLLIERSVIRDTRASSQHAGGGGVVAQEQGRLVLAASAILGNDNSGVTLFDSGTEATISETVIADTRQPGTDFGRGVQVQDGATLSLTRSVLRNNVQTGLNLSRGTTSGARTRATVEQVTISGTKPTRAPVPIGDGLHQYAGYGVRVQKGSRLEASRLAVVRNQEVGVLLSDPQSNAQLVNALVAETLVNPGGYFGRGVVVITGATAEIRSSVIASNQEGGIDVEGPDGESTVRVFDSAVLGTRQSRPGEIVAIGALARSGARLDLHRTLVGMSEAATGVVYADSRGTLSAAEVIGNRVGMSAQEGSAVVEEEPPAREPALREVLVTSDSRFVDNEIRLSSSAIPLPPAPVALER